MNEYDNGPTQQLYASRVVYLSGDVTTDLAAYVVGRLVALDSIDPDAEIRLYISSFGGSVYAGLAIYDAMQMIDAPVTTLCIGPAFSMAALLAAAGVRGRRFATPNARIMLHQASAGLAGSASDIRVAAENILKNERLLNELLARHTSRPVEAIAEVVQRDLWLTPQEAIAFGVLDAVVPVSRRKEAVEGSQVHRRRTGTG